MTIHHTYQNFRYHFALDKITKDLGGYEVWPSSGSLHTLDLRVLPQTYGTTKGIGVPDQSPFPVTVQSGGALLSDAWDWYLHTPADTPEKALVYLTEHPSGTNLVKVQKTALGLSLYPDDTFDSLFELFRHTYVYAQKKATMAIDYVDLWEFFCGKDVSEVGFANE